MNRMKMEEECTRHMCGRWRYSAHRQACLRRTLLCVSVLDYEVRDACHTIDMVRMSGV